MRSIAEVELVTGLPRATIRIWERRYGFPSPARDDRGERLYPADQVEQMRQMHALIQQGHRPAALLSRGASGIQALLQEAAPSAPKSLRNRNGARLLRLLRSHDAAGLRAELQALVDGGGLFHFATETAPGLSQAVGEAWAAGELQVHEEHLYSDLVDELLRAQIAALRARERPEAPRVLLTTFPQEAHGLGLRMAQAVFALQGCPTVSLGVRTPLDQIAAAARAHGADLVGVSFSAFHNASHVMRGLEELRGLIPPPVRVWAGGPVSHVKRRKVAGVRFVTHSADIPPLLAEDFALPPR